MITFLQFLKENEDEYLYHATYQVHKNSIAKHGLKANSNHKNWEDSKKGRVYLAKRSRFESTQSQIMQRSEDLINAASNRYRITVQVANRAKRRRYEDFENNEDSIMKPVLRAIIEMSDELTQPEIIGELPSDWL